MKLILLNHHIKRGGDCVCRVPALYPERAFPLANDSVQVRLRVDKT